MADRQAYLREAIELPQFTPRRDDAPILVAMGTLAPKPLLGRLAVALGRLPADVALHALQAALAPTNDVPVRVAACELARRLPAHHAAVTIAACSLAARDSDVAVRKSAIRALSNHDDADAVAALVGMVDREALAQEEVAQLARALAKVGRGEALRTLARRVPGLDTSVGQVIAARHDAREQDVSVDVHRSFASGQLLVECRDGVGPIAQRQYESLGIPCTAAGENLLVLRAETSVHRALACRSAMRVGFAVADASPGADIAGVLTAAHHTMRQVTTGPLRYRLDWPGATAAKIHEVAVAVHGAHPDMINDPRGAAWHIGLHRPYWVAWPVGVEDGRFAWREGQVPAASHPTLAAALAFLARPIAGDRVWDPFCGSGAELVECGVLAPGAALLGSDTSPEAIGIARRNLAAAGHGARAELGLADALASWPDATVVITNPPHGGRVKADTVALHTRFFAHVAARLPRGGRLAWIRHAKARVEGTPMVCEASYPMTLAGQAMRIEAWSKR